MKKILYEGTDPKMLEKLTGKLDNAGISYVVKHPKGQISSDRPFEVAPSGLINSLIGFGARRDETEGPAYVIRVEKKDMNAAEEAINS